MEAQNVTAISTHFRTPQFSDNIATGNELLNLFLKQFHQLEKGCGITST